MKYHLFFSWLLFFFIFMGAPFSLAQDDVYHLKLLAVQEVLGGYQGSDADLYLELREGTGRVFLETYPLTKLDTQISTRFAKDIACNHFNVDCNQYDFFYTIKAKSNIIGGPSAGAAISALTAIAVMGLDYDSTIAVTGTINSGGIIGPIGGVKGKLEAAAQAGLKKVLVAQGSVEGSGEDIQSILEEEDQENDQEENTSEGGRGSSDSSNSPNSTSESSNNSSTSLPVQKIPTSLPLQNSTVTIPLQNSTIIIPLPNLTPETPFLESNLSRIVELGNNLSLEVIEVIDLDEVVFHLTGKEFNGKVHEIIANEEYSEIMANLQQLLCDRTSKLQGELRAERILLNQTVIEEVRQKEQAARNSTEKKDYYSAASFCFGNNINLKTIYYREKKLTPSAYERLFRILEQKSLALDQEVDAETIDTISDLQAYMVVKERLSDVQEQVKKFSVNTTSEETAGLLAYSEERLFSAISWKQFFAMDGKKFVMDEDILKMSCVQKISEAEERYQYINLFLGEGNLLRIREKITSAKRALESNESALCLITAAQAKADANAILSSFGLVDENLDRFLESKQKAVERVIYDNSQEGIFPILGYSYYEYANSLREEKMNTLVYFEYALEMSDLSMYFPEEKNYFIRMEKFTIDEKWRYLFFGFVIGMLVMWLVKRRK